MPSFQEAQTINVSYMFREPVFSNKLLFTLLPNRLFTEVTDNLYISQQLLNRLGYSQFDVSLFLPYKKNTLIAQKDFLLSYPASIRSEMEFNTHVLNIE